jgi:uncharacterized membrane protein
MALEPSSVGDNRIVAAANSRRGTPAQVLRAVLIGFVVAAIFAPGAALHWAETLPDGPVATALSDVAARWNEALSAADASEPREWLHHAVRAFEAMHF